MAGLLLGTVSIAAQGVMTDRVEVVREESEQADFTLVRVVRGLDHPWSLAFLPDGRYLISERPGNLLLVDGDAVAELDGLPAIVASGQGGLLDIALHPDFEDNGWIYLSYSTRVGSGLGTAVARARLSGSRLVDVERVFLASTAAEGGRHFGSRLAFAGDGTLYITLGERGERNRAQDLTDTAGSVVRLNDDGSVPQDNPFVSDGEARAEIYTWGHRNAQGLAVNPATGEVWLHEHGPQGGDEINILRPGLNYGWPIISYGGEYGSGRQVGEGTSKPGLEQPVSYWFPSIAPSGMMFYTGDAFPQWRGDLFVGALVKEHLRRVELDGDRVVAEEVLLEWAIGRVRDVRQGPDGMIYLLTDESNAGLYRLEPVQ